MALWRVVALAAILLLPQMAAAQETVRARGWSHSDFGRLVFDWAAPAGFETALEGRTLAIRFDRPLDADLDNALGFLEGYLLAGRLGEDGRTVILTLAADFAVDSFANGASVVVDFSQPDPAAPADAAQAARADAAPAPEPEAPPPPAPEPRAESTPAPAVAATPAGTSAETPAETSTDPPPARPPETAEAAPPPAAPPPPETATGEVPVAAPAPEPPGEPVAAAAPAPEPTLDASTLDARDVAFRMADQALAALEGGQGSAAPAGEGAATLEAADPVEDLVTFTFSWPDLVGAAVFPRGGYIFIVFDRREAVDLAPFRQAGREVVERIEQLPVQSGTVIRLKPMPGIGASARREGFDWAVGLRDGATRPREPVSITIGETDTGALQLLLRSDDPGGVVSFQDPEVGDRLQVATLKQSGAGIAGTRLYPDFRLLASAQGAAIETLADDVLVERSFDGVAILRPEGLSLSGLAPDAPVSIGAALSSRRLFDFDNWLMRGPDFYRDDEQMLIQAAAGAGEGARPEARLNLARFYVAQARWPEALGVLRTIANDDEGTAQRAEFRALRGAANLLAGRVGEAREDWADPRLDGFQETALWRGALLAAEQNWREANLQFAPAETLLRNYPYPLKAHLGLMRVEAALQASDIRVGGSWIEQLTDASDRLTRGQYADVRYHRARIEVTRDNLEAAEDIWGRLAGEADARNAARSQFALISIGLSTERMSVEEAIEGLEHLRYTWRGDRFELVVLRTLARLRLAVGDYLEALRDLRAAVTYFPDDPLAESITAQMTDIFRRLYLDGEADMLEPLRALAIFDEFRELTPPGPDGDRMIELLADRLVSVDLLGRAAEQLEHQIEFRLQGPERARVGAKLALTYLMDGRPEEALSALGESSVPGIARDLEDDRRRLRAKAEFELGRIDDALSLLAGDISREGDLLRRDFFWEMQDWPEAAKVLQRLTGDPPPPGRPLDEERARHALNWAVALQLSDDREGLALLRDLYVDAMRGGPMEEMFDYITAPGARDRPQDFQAALDRLSRDRQFDAFMRNYRDKLMTPPANDGPPGVSVSSADGAGDGAG